MDGPFEREHGPVTSELLVRVATLFNDFNPAHYDAAFAASAGLPGVIAPATLLQAWMLADVRSVEDGEGGPWPVRDVDLRLRQPYLVGETVTLAYTPTEAGYDVEARAGGGELEARVIATARIGLAARAEGASS